MTNICEFYPELVIGDEHPSAFDAVEIHGIRGVRFDRDGKLIVEACDDADAEFWSVYLHKPGWGIECVGDFALIQDAEAAAELLVEQYGYRSWLQHPTRSNKSAAANCPA